MAALGEEALPTQMITKNSSEPLLGYTPYRHVFNRSGAYQPRPPIVHQWLIMWLHSPSLAEILASGLMWSTTGAWLAARDRRLWFGRRYPRTEHARTVKNPILLAELQTMPRTVQTARQDSYCTASCYLCINYMQFTLPIFFSINYSTPIHARSTGMHINGSTKEPVVEGRWPYLVWPHLETWSHPFRHLFWYKMH